MEMMHPSLLIAFLLIFMSFTDPSSTRIKRTIDLQTDKSVEYTYKDGLVSKVRNANGAETVYHYQNNVVIRQFTNGAENTIDTFFLNGNGLADSSHSSNAPEMTSRYEWNSNNQMVREEIYRNGTLVMANTKSYDSLGNVKVLSQRDGAQIGIDIKYTYYSDKLNTIGNDAIGMTFMGASTKNLVKQSSTWNMKGDVVAANKFFYHFDNNGVLISKASYQSDGGLTDSTGYLFY